MVTADELRQVVQSLPQAEERETWGHPTFRVRDKMFAVMSDDGQQASVKATTPLSSASFSWRHGAKRPDLARRGGQGDQVPVGPDPDPGRDRHGRDGGGWRHRDRSA
jgi:hypothetical protein